MKMKRHEQYRVTDWGGGQTTELVVYPPESTYEKRDFLFRISSATVADVHSVFTRLDGVRRILMVLRGRLRLTHNGVQSGWLAEKEQTAFSGGWETESEGRATDFNLMLRGQTEGTMTWVALPPGAEKRICISGSGHQGIAAVYLLSGTLRFSDVEGCAEGRPHDLGMANINQGIYTCTIKNAGTMPAECLLMQIYLE